ncbi:hypothetical protein GQ44DRAFT_768117 [Phaeosphaeriaceae sp. PMI808]|nr:hypothetical protein GQ44DRAFT_768117 [Phaeosphaeriaceae sp. PMI808]
MSSRGATCNQCGSETTKSSNNANLQSPLCLPDLDTPASSSSLTYPLSDLTPLAAAFDNLALVSLNRPSHSTTTTPIAKMRPPRDIAPGGLPPKREEKARGHGRTEPVDNYQNSFSSSKMLQQVLAIQPPEPFVSPPQMPAKFEQNFIAGLQEYGMDIQMQVSNPLGAFSRAAGMQSMGSMGGGGSYGSVLHDIAEENEHRVAAIAGKADSTGAVEGLRIFPPAYHSGHQAVAGPSPAFVPPATDWPSTSFYNDAYSDGNAAMGSFENLAFDPYRISNSNAAFAGGQSSRLGRSTVANVPLFSPQQNYSNFDAGFLPSQSYSNLNNPSNLPQLVLFPSASIGMNPTWEFAHTNSGFTPTSSSKEVSVHDQFSRQNQKARTASRASGQALLPHMMPTSKKRGATSQDQLEPNLPKTRASNSTTGLPTLADDLERTWTVKFPGNTYALLTVILQWSLTLQRLHRQLPDPYLFSINTAFPYPVNPPIHQKLVSVAFYDALGTPHKEIRYIGPGDGVDISYNEIDVFTYPEDAYVDPEQAKHDERFETMKRKLGIKGNQSTKDPQNTAMRQRATKGEGRWAYIMLQGHRNPVDMNETPPHAVIAWHITATTEASECLYTVYPDHYKPSSLAVPSSIKDPRRFSSLQNVNTRANGSRRLYQDLRSASSSEVLPKGLAVHIAAPPGALTLKREVLKMQKAGKIPLIEGFKVDVQKFKGWMDAVGKGRGKVVMWRKAD